MVTAVPINCKTGVITGEARTFSDQQWATMKKVAGKSFSWKEKSRVSDVTLTADKGAVSTKNAKSKYGTETEVIKEVSTDGKTKKSKKND